MMLDAHKSCDELVGPHLNLAGIYFHELMFYLCSACYRKEYGNYSKVIDNKVESANKLSTIPFLGYRKHKPSFTYKVDVTRPRKVFEALSRIYGSNNKKIGILNPALDFKVLSKLLIKNRFQAVFPVDTRIYIPKLRLQFNILSNLIEDVYRSLQLNGAPQNLIDAMIKSLDLITVDQPISSPEYSVLLSGAPNLKSRLLMADALARNIPVLCVAHGNQSGSDDNPMWGYDDRSYCTHYLGYGNGGKIDVNKSDFIKSISGTNPIYIPSNSNFIKDNYSRDRINKLNFGEFHNYKIAYLPIKLTGLDRLGPFISIFDEDYLDWQRDLFNQIPGMAYKKHPKQQNIKYKLGLDGVNVISDPIEKCVNEFDVFVIDWAVSTVVANIVATTKPIIYFNIGIGKLTPKAEELFRERCIWIDVNLDNPGDLLNKIEMQSDKEFFNNYTSLFCLDGTDEIREETVVNTLNYLVKGSDKV